MPQDANGEPLKLGDEILIRGTVAWILEREEFINFGALLKEPMCPLTRRDTVIQLNTRQVKKAPAREGDMGDSPQFEVHLTASELLCIMGMLERSNRPAADSALVKVTHAYARSQARSRPTKRPATAQDNK